jgi:hypothetical protein
MKKFVITTTSESSDHYVYFVEHPKEPTDKELERFLEEHANDKDEDEVYESVDSVDEIKDFLTIPEKKKK